MVRNGLWTVISPPRQAENIENTAFRPKINQFLSSKTKIWNVWERLLLVQLPPAAPDSPFFRVLSGAGRPGIDYTNFVNLGAFPCSKSGWKLQLPNLWEKDLTYRRLQTTHILEIPEPILE